MVKVRQAVMMMMAFILLMGGIPLSWGGGEASADTPPGTGALAAPASISAYAQPSKYAAFTNYRVTANGVEVPVVKAFSDYDYAHFSASEGPITYEVTILNTDKVHEYSISPKKLGIKADSVVGTKLTFTTQKDEYLIVMMNGRATRLVIAADPAETDMPQASGAGIFNVSDAPYSIAPNGGKTGVPERTAALQQAIDDASAYGTAQGNGAQGIVYVPAGEYYVGNLVLKSNTALYLQPGAALIGTGKTADYTEHWFKDSMGRPATWWISTAFDSDNIKIYGRGTIDGNGQALHDDKSTNNKGMINNLVVPIATSNFKMDGVIIRESAAWAVMPVRSNDLEFTNLKMFNSLGMGENDGIDIVESQNAVIRNSIGIALDDPYSTKAWKEDTDIASGRVPWPGSPEPVRNVLFEDAISWTKCYGYKIGQGVMQNQEDIVFRDGVVYKAAVGFAIHHKYGTGTINNVVFENMDIEDIDGKNEDNSAWMTMFTVDSGGNGVGPVNGVTVKNITVRDVGDSFSKLKGQEGAEYTGLTFENVYMPGKTAPAQTLAEMNFLDKEYYSGVIIKPVQGQEPRVKSNMALKQPAVISSNDGTVETAHFAVDGLLSTRSGTKREVDPGWLYVDLGETKRINEARIIWEAAYGKSYKIQVSQDTEQWTDVYSTTAGKGGTEKIAFNETDARYVRMYGTERATKYGYSMWEFEVYGPEVLPEGIQLDKKAISLLPGDTTGLSATVLPLEATNKKVLWSSSNTNAASVDDAGLITAKAPGTAVITAKTLNGEWRAAATVTVKKIGAPQLLAATSEDRAVTLDWKLVEGATGYRIFTGTASGNYELPEAAVASSVYSHRIEGLTNGTPYYFVIKATHPGGDSSASNEVTGTPIEPLTGAPVMNAAVPGDAQVELSWVPAEGAAGYRIYARSATGTYGLPVETVNSSVYSYTAGGLTNGEMYAFRVDAMNGMGYATASNEVSAMPLPAIPAAPVLNPAQAGDAHANLSWQPVEGAESYQIFISTEAGKYDGPSATVGSSVYGYKAEGLENGTVYYFMLKALNIGGASSASNEVQAAPKTVPGAPVNVTAAASDGQAAVSFTAPADGGSPITRYEVVSNPGEITVTGSASPVTVTGLINGVSYTFTVRAVNSEGIGAASEVSNAVVPAAATSSGGDTGGSDPEPFSPGGTRAGGQNGGETSKETDLGLAATSRENGQTVTVIKLDPEKLAAKLEQAEEGAVITIPVDAASDRVIGELAGSMLKDLAQKKAVIRLQSEQGSYMLPAEQINLQAIAEQLGSGVDVQAIKIQIEIGEPSEEGLKAAEQAAVQGQLALVGQPVHFAVKAAHGATAVELGTFTAYVEKTIVLPDGTDISRIMTGVAVEADGSLRHVPTQIISVDGRHYAKLNSLTNGTYAVVQHTAVFNDMAGHWAQEAVTNLGSRLIVNGTDAGLFSPDREMTRAEFAAVLVRGLGLRLEVGASSFSDVSETQWFNGAIRTAASYGLVGGFGEGSFQPEAQITREQAMVMISRAMKVTRLGTQLPATDEGSSLLQRFGDNQQVSDWAADSLASILQSGIAGGRTEQLLEPQAYVTRAEVAVMIERLLRESGLI
ncbi:MAG: coagulation factor 5/8 type domain protein [Paenibacillaceae bacterium]|nr:coagulation factor 5/8 type domain protein [Paenibacillaceae bacterium]